MAKKPGPDNELIIIKKYANRRLYNTDSSCYVTLDDLARMVKKNKDFIVRDAKSGDDITHGVLTQIIIEEENKGDTLLPVNFLRQLITYYGDGLQKVVPGYLENSMMTFSRNQEKFRSFVEGNMPNATPGRESINPFEEMIKQNMAIFEQTMSMFSPFGVKKETETNLKAAQDTGPDSAFKKDQLADLQAQLAAMQAQINSLQNK